MIPRPGRRAVLAGALALATLRPARAGAAALVPFHPVQEPCPPRAETRGWRTVTPLADFRVRGLLLAKRRYAEGREATIAAWDVVLGWGALSDPAVVGALRVEQADRYAAFYWAGAPRATPEAIILNSANIHVVPGDPAVPALIAALPTGAILQLEGQLVQVDDADGWRWSSSLARDDTGAGACELMLVHRAAQLP